MERSVQFILRREEDLEMWWPYSKCWFDLLHKAPNSDSPFPLSRYLACLESSWETISRRSETTLTELRSQFWIICGRSLVKQLIGKCVICRRFEGKPYNAPIPPPLPPFRVQEAPPFSSSGVDFAGPLYIKHENELSTDFAKRRCDVFRCMNVMKVVVEGTIDFSCVWTCNEMSSLWN